MSTTSTDKGAPLARRTYRLEEVAKLLGVGRNQAYEAIHRPDCPFPVIRIGKRIVVPKIAIDRLLGISE